MKGREKRCTKFPGNWSWASISHALMPGFSGGYGGGYAAPATLGAEVFPLWWQVALLLQHKVSLMDSDSISMFFFGPAKHQGHIFWGIPVFVLNSMLWYWPGIANQRHEHGHSKEVFDIVCQWFFRTMWIIALLPSIETRLLLRGNVPASGWAAWWKGLQHSAPYCSTGPTWPRNLKEILSWSCSGLALVIWLLIRLVVLKV